jgi:hypothetical protein
MSIQTKFSSTFDDGAEEMSTRWIVKQWTLLCFRLDLICMVIFLILDMISIVAIVYL